MMAFLLEILLGNAACLPGTYYNNSSGACDADCGHGYYHTGEGKCICDIGWDMSQGKCSGEASAPYNTPLDGPLFDWFYLGLISILLCCFLYILITWCYYKRTIN